MTREGKGKRLRDQKGKGKERNRNGTERITFFAGSDLTYGTARTHARTHDTKRNDFPVGLTPQPPILSHSKYTYFMLQAKMIHDIYRENSKSNISA